MKPKKIGMVHLKGINDKNFSVRSFQERAAINLS